MTHALRLSLSLAVAVVGAPAAAQDATRRFDVGGFDAIDLASSDAVRVLPGSGFSVSASGDPRAVASLVIAVRDGVLRVDRSAGAYSDRGAVVTVAMPVLRAATLSGSGGIAASGVTGRSFAGRVSGSGRIALGGIAVGEARFVLDGSGSIVADGRIGAVAIDLDGSGRIDTRQVATRTMVVDLGGSGSVVATSTGTAAIRASGSGHVRVGGGPRCDVRNSGTASVRCG